MQQVMRAAGTPQTASEMMEDDPADSASGTVANQYFAAIGCEVLGALPA